MLINNNNNRINDPAMYAPYKNTFEAQLRCSQSGDPCSSNQQCHPNCEQPERHNPMFCLGSPYLKERNMGTCYQRWARQGDACVVGQYPHCQTHNGVPLYCQQTLDVDSRPNSAPTFAAPYVGEGFCMPRPQR